MTKKKVPSPLAACPSWLLPTAAPELTGTVRSYTYWDSAEHIHQTKKYRNTAVSVVKIPRL